MTDLRLGDKQLTLLLNMTKNTSSPKLSILYYKNV